MAKRNAAGAGSIRKKTVLRDGREYTYWEARLTVGVDPGTGKQIRRSFSGKTQKEVREEMQSAAVAVNDSTYQEPTKLTVSDWLDVWLSEYTGDVKPLTRSTYKNKVESAIKPALDRRAAASQIQGKGRSVFLRLSEKRQNPPADPGAFGDEGAQRAAAGTDGMEIEGRGALGRFRIGVYG